jgi:CSLREA domain-containing protein
MSTLVFARLASSAWIVMVLLAVSAVRADVTFNVNSAADLADDNTSDGVCHTSAGSCSLRAAIMQANHWSNPEFAIINLPAGLYVLSVPVPVGGVDDESVGDLNLTTALIAVQRIIINGQSAASTIIDGNQAGRVIAVAQGRSATIARVTIRHGSTPFGGAGIYNQGNLTLFSSVVEQNTAGTGGGICNDQGTLLVKASTLRSNVAAYGGGINTLSPGSPVTIRESTISGNHANTGGGIYNNGNPLYVVNSTISANTADTDGGGIFSRIAAFIYNTTVVDNDADDDHDEIGGIGGGVFIDAGSRFVAVNSLIAANYAVGYVEPNDCHGTLEVYGWNLFGFIGATCAFIGNGVGSRGMVLPGTIGQLQDNGGPTWTHALLVGSQAIDSTHDSLGCVDESGTPLSIDQRGGSRPVGARCDVGAFEFAAVTDRIFMGGFE